MGRARLLAVSLGAHALLAAVLGAIPPKVRHEVIPIRMVETKKPRPVDDVAPRPPVSTPAAQPVRAVPRGPARPRPPAPAARGAAAASVPDFGLTLSGGSGGEGLAVPTGGVGGPAAEGPAAAKSFARPAPANVPGDCAEPPGKPQPVTRVQPAYPEEARVAGVAGKVRVEITVDARGRVVSARLLQGLGHGCDEAALAAARAMTFEPAVRCGKAAAATFRVAFHFAPSSP